MDTTRPLFDAFTLQSSELVAFVGGGGKTSLMFSLAHQLPGRVVVTTTTRIFTAQMKLAQAVLTTGGTELGTEKLGRETFLTSLSHQLARYGSCLVVGKVEGDKALGVDATLPGMLLDRPDVDFVLVEADGSRMRPVKAPAEHEPVVPPESTLLVPVVGIDALGGQVKHVAHRPEQVCRLLNDSRQPAAGSHQTWRSDSRLTPEAVATLLVHPHGGLKGATEGARIIPFINKVESIEQLSAARRIARHTLHATAIAHVIIGAVKHKRQVWEIHKRITAVVLAAGQASRMGQTKQLLPWGDTTVLGQTLRNLQQSAVHQILVVSGHEHQAVEAIAAEAGIEVVYNSQYATGEMLSSLQTAVKRLPESSAAVLVMLADQPMVEPATIDRLLEAYWQGQGELIAPVYQERRGNPVLIGRTYFDQLLALPPGSAPRDLLQRHQNRVHLVPVMSDSILRDLDRPEEYEQWRP